MPDHTKHQPKHQSPQGRCYRGCQCGLGDSFSPLRSVQERKGSRDPQVKHVTEDMLTALSPEFSIHTLYVNAPLETPDCLLEEFDCGKWRLQNAFGRKGRHCVTDLLITF